MTIHHLYFPAPGQTDAPARAAALGASIIAKNYDSILGTTIITATFGEEGFSVPEKRYGNQLSVLPALVCDHEDEGFVVLPEPTTLAAIEAAHDVLLSENIPSDTVRTPQLINDIATHSAAVNPHNITPANIGAVALSQVGTLTGPKGDKGDKGDTGTNGTNGTNGAPGTNGVGVTALCKKITVDTSHNQIALIDVPEMLLPVPANFVGGFKFGVLFSTAALTTGIKLSASIPAGATVAWVDQIPISLTALKFGVVRAGDGGVASTAVDTANANMVAVIEGVIQNGANAGNIQLRMGSEVANSAVIVKKGSYGWLI